MTKLYALVALAVGVLVLGPARAQTQSEADWLACMEVWADEAICGPRPAPEPPPPPPPPPPEEEPPPPPPPPPPEEEPPPPPPPPPPEEEPPPPPEPEQCAKGNHSGHSVASGGNATGHVCGGSAERHGHRGHKHGKRDSHVAKAKAVLKQLGRLCAGLFGRH